MEGLTERKKQTLVSKRNIPGKDEGRKYSSRRNSWCQPDVFKAGEKAFVATAQWERGRWPYVGARLYRALEGRERNLNLF